MGTRRKQKNQIDLDDLQGKAPSGIVILSPRDDQEWHQMRSRDVTASVIGALFDCHPYVTEYELWLTKSSPVCLDDETPAMRRGRLLEPVAVEMIREERPEWLIYYSTAQNIYFRYPSARIGATPDVIAVTPNGRAIVQIKTVARQAWRAGWVNDQGDTEPPMWIALQAEVERSLVGADLAFVAAMVIDSGGGLELDILPVPTIPNLFDAMAKRSLKFWDRVDLIAPPPDPDFSRDAAAIERATKLVDPDHALDLTGDDEIEALIAERAALAVHVRDAQARIDEIKAQIQHRLGDACEAYLRGGRVITRSERFQEARVYPAGQVRHVKIPKPIGDES